MEQEGMCSMWFTLSAADNHWLDLHQLIYGNTTLPRFDTELLSAQWKRKLVRENQHIVDAYFYDRVKMLLATFFGKKGLELEWFWFRVEYQKRGAAHVHGCFKLKNDPGISQLSQAVLRGRISAKRLWLHGLLPEENEFDIGSIVDDTWLADGDLRDGDYGQFTDKPTEEELDGLLSKIESAKEAHKIIIAYHDFYLTTSHPNPPADAGLEKRHPSTIFDQVKSPNTSHPSSLDPREIISSKHDVEYCSLVNTIERHACQAYCDRNHKKRKKEKKIPLK